MVLSGHVSGEYHQISQNEIGLDVIEILADYQSRPNGGDGWMQLLEFLPELGRIEVQTYSPTRDEYETDGDSQFSLSIDFDQRLDSTSSILSIGDVAELEGADGATTDFVFTVARTGDISRQSTVNFATASGTATEDDDFVGTSGTLTFPANDSSPQTITVPVNGDGEVEPDETFVVDLSIPTNATIADGQGQGTITNDDNPSTTISIDDVTVIEGDASIRFMDAFIPAGSGGLDIPREPVFGPDGNGRRYPLEWLRRRQPQLHLALPFRKARGGPSELGRR